MYVYIYVTKGVDFDWESYQCCFVDLRWLEFMRDRWPIRQPTNIHIIGATNRCDYNIGMVFSLFGCKGGMETCGCCWRM